MADTSKNPKVLDAAHAPMRLETLESLSEGLEKCQKSLNDYLDSKRNAFPRYVHSIMRVCIFYILTSI